MITILFIYTTNEQIEYFCIAVYSKIVWFEFCSDGSHIVAFANLPTNHAPGKYFNPYNDFFNLYTF